MTTDQTTITGMRVGIDSDQPVRVTIEPVVDAPYFRVFSEFRKHVAELTPGAVRVALYLFEHRDRYGTVTRKTRADIIRDEGMPKQTVSDAINVLMRHPARLLSEHSEGFELMPGRQFLQRAPRGSGPPDRLSENPDVRPDARTPRALSARPSESSSDPLNQKLVVVQKNKADDDEAVRLLTTPGPRKCDIAFTVEAARGLLRSTGASVEQVRTALRNAAHKASDRVRPEDALKPGGWRGYISTQLERGCTLFEALRAVDERIERNARALGAMRADGSLTPEQADTVLAWWKQASPPQQAGLFTPDVLAERFGALGRGRDRWIDALDRAGALTVRGVECKEC